MGNIPENPNCSNTPDLKAAARRIASIHSIPPHLARDLASLAGFPDDKELSDQQLQNKEDAQK